MKKTFIIFLISCVSALLLLSIITYAYQTNLSNYYPSPSGNYTKAHLINKTGGPNQNYAAAGGCFAPKTLLILTDSMVALVIPEEAEGPPILMPEPYLQTQLPAIWKSVKLMAQ